MAVAHVHVQSACVDALNASLAILPIHCVVPSILNPFRALIPNANHTPDPWMEDCMCVTHIGSSTPTKLSPPTSCFCSCGWLEGAATLCLTLLNPALHTILRFRCPIVAICCTGACVLANTVGMLTHTTCCALVPGG